MRFDRIATKVADHVGRPWAFCFAAALVIIWLPSIFVIGDIDTWQLIINTATTIITFLVVFLIQHTQNRDTCEIKAMLQALTDHFELHSEKRKHLENQEESGSE